MEPHSQNISASHVPGVKLQAGMQVMAKITSPNRNYVKGTWYEVKSERGRLFVTSNRDIWTFDGDTVDGEQFDLANPRQAESKWVRTWTDEDMHEAFLAGMNYDQSYKAPAFTAWLEKYKSQSPNPKS